MDDTTAHLRDFLDNWRVSKGWSIQRFADEVEVHQSLASKWLHPNPSRRVTPSARRLRKVAEVIGVPYAQLRDLAELNGTEDAAESDAVAGAAVQAELDARIARLRARLSRYPRAFWLAVLEANDKMADALDACVPEHPLSASGEVAFSARADDLNQHSDGSDRDSPNLTKPSFRASTTRWPLTRVRDTGRPSACSRTPSMTRRIGLSVTPRARSGRAAGNRVRRPTCGRWVAQLRRRAQGGSRSAAGPLPW